MALIDEINQKSKEIHTDEYSISIGELVNMYKDGDLNIHPEFQRFFRWTDSQKTRLIESFLLNIPVPPIFISQRNDGIWEVIDGLQRVSTILQFMGLYKDEHDNRLDPLTLMKTKMLPSLEGMKYQDANDEEHSFSEVERRYLKRAKISLKILLKSSDQENKYELFQRLNTGGTSLSDQEVRNCLLVMTDADRFQKFETLSQYPQFQNTLRLNDAAVAERYDMELLTRFVCLRKINTEELSQVSDLGEFLNERIVSIFSNPNYDWEKEEHVFKKTFDTIASHLGDTAFCKYDLDKQKFIGRFYVSVYEFVAIGLGRRDAELPANFDLSQKIIDLWRKIYHDNISWSGWSGAARIRKTLNLSNQLYDEN